MGDAVAIARKRTAGAGIRSGGRRGAALIIVIAIMTILLAIALTFFTNANVAQNAATNVANQARVGFVQDGATAITQATLNQDFLHNSGATSNDHPWKTLYNGTAFAGKPWARYKGSDMADLGASGTRQPAMPEFDFSAIQNCADCPLYIRFPDGVVEPLFQGSRSKQWLFIPRYQGPSAATNNHNALVLYDCVELCDENGTVISDRAAYLSALDSLNAELATQNFYIAYYSGPDTIDCLRDTFWPENFDRLPKLTDEDIPFVTTSVFGETFASVNNPVIGTSDTDGEYAAQQVNNYADVDNDDDGLNDSVWIPIPIDLYYNDDGVDNNLNGWIDEQQDNGVNDDGAGESGDMAMGDGIEYVEGGDTSAPKRYNDPDEAIESGVFAYYGGSDGLDNDGDTLVDDSDPDENGSGPNRGLFLTAPLPGLSFYVDLNADGVAYDLVPDDAIYQQVLASTGNDVTALRASLKPLRVTLPSSIVVLFDTEPLVVRPGDVDIVPVQLGPGNVDAIDNDYDLVVNDYSAYCYVGPNTLAQPFRPPFETYFDGNGYFVRTASDDTFNSYLRILGSPAVNIWAVTNAPPQDYYAIWRSQGNWFQPVPTFNQTQLDASPAFNGPRAFSTVATSVGDPHLFDRARRKAFIDINDGAFDLDGDGEPDFTFSPRIIHLETGEIPAQLNTSYDLNNDPAFLNAIHITHSGEPVCEIAGRVAIRVDDVNSKVNLNVAGAHTPNDEYPYHLGVRYADDGDIRAGSDAGPVSRASLGQGVDPSEYEIRMLPQIGQARAGALWMAKVGTPGNGVGQKLDVEQGGSNGKVIAPPGGGQPDYTFDMSFPGYGRVDDNADALLLSLDARDDNGNGLIDEGLFLPSLSADAADVIFNNGAVSGFTYGSLRSGFKTDAYANNLRNEVNRYLEYFNRLGNLEGVDDAREFQIAAALRNFVAERDRLDNNAGFVPADQPPLTDESGELGDRVYSDVNAQEILERAGFPAATLNKLKQILTTFSSDRNASFVSTASGAIRALKRLDFNFATAQQIAAALVVQGGFEPMTTRTVSFEGATFPQVGKRGDDVNGVPVDTNAFAEGLRRANTNLRAPDPTGNPDNGTGGSINRPGNIGDLSKTGDLLTGGMMFVRSGPQYFTPTTSGPSHEVPADPFLDALQLAANIVDNADRDHARTQLTTENVDSHADAVELQAVDSWPRDTDLNNRERIRLSELFPTEDIENYIKNVLGLTPRVVQAVDTWWENYVVGATAPNGDRRGEQRHFSYTAAGNEAIKINEIMVRPVRRVEAEMVRASYPDSFSPGVVHMVDRPEFVVTNSAIDPLIFDSPLTGDFETTKFDPAPGFDLDGDGTFDSDPLPDFNLTRQVLLRWPGFGVASGTWTTDTAFGLADPANVIGPGVAISTEGNARQTAPNTSGFGIDVPDVVQFIIRGADVDPNDPFAPPAGLPGGRYYLTVNTTDPVTGEPTVNEGGELDYAIKYIDEGDITIDNPGVNLPADGSILGDIYTQFDAAATTTDLDNWLDTHFVTVPAEHVAGKPGSGTYLEGRPSGWVFLDGTPDSVPTASINGDHYFVDGGEIVALPADRERAPLDPAVATHTVYVPEAGSGIALCIAFKRTADVAGNPNPPKISINFFDFQQQPDHEYVEVTNTSQNAISMDGWKLEIGIPKPKDTRILDDPHKSIWEVPQGTTIAPGGMLLLGFDVFDGFQVPGGDVWRDSTTGTGVAVANSIGHNGMGLAAWKDTGGPVTPFDALANVSAPPIRDISSTVNPQFDQMFAPLGRFADVTGSVFTRALDTRFGGAFDYVDRDGDGLSSYALSADETTYYVDGVPTTIPSSVTFDALISPPNGVPRQALYSIDAIADDARLENGVIRSTDPNADPEHNLINALGNAPNKPWDRLVQLKCVQIRRRAMDEEIVAAPSQNPVYNNQRLYPDGSAVTLKDPAYPDEADEVADIVLRGGFLPDYPEHDGYDNDGDGGYYIANDQLQCAPATPLSRKPFRYDYVPGTLDKDMIDNNLNGIIDERGPGINNDADVYGCLDPNNLTLPDVIPDLALSEGVDEGDLYRSVDPNLSVGSDIRPLRQYGPGSFEASLLPAIFFNNRALYPVDRTFMEPDPTAATTPNTPSNPYVGRFPDNLPTSESVGISAVYDTNVTGAIDPVYTEPSVDNRVTRLGLEEDFDTTSSPAINGFEEATYLGSDLDPPDWKAFTERRWNPGDNVIVSLYDDEDDLVDRATYREYDVINRTIDDVAPCPYFVDLDGDGVFNPATDGPHLNLVPEQTPDFMPIDGEVGLAAPYPGLPSVWRPNQMGLDFYRSLERKDPDYAGDVYGTSNRWEPTDGNYDDWADSMPLFRAIQTTNEAGEPEALPRIVEGRMTPRFIDPTINPATFDGWAQDMARLYRHCIWGSPLRMNLASRLLRNPVDLPRLFLEFNGPPAPTSYTVDDYVNATTDRGGTQRTTADARPFGQFPSRVGGLRLYGSNLASQGTPFDHVEDNRDWTLYKAAGADRFSHRDYPNEREYADGINTVLTPRTTAEFPAILKAGTPSENMEYPIDNPFLADPATELPEGNAGYGTRRGMDEPYRTNADLMRVPMMMFQHDMFNISFAKGVLDTGYPNEAFVAVQDPQGYEQSQTWNHFPKQLISGVLGTDETDLDTSRPWAVAAQRDDTNAVFGRDSNNRTRESMLARASDLMSTQPIVLSAGQATFLPVAPAKFEFDSNGHVYPGDRPNYSSLINWIDNPSIPEQATAPEAWSPIFLYELPGDSNDSGPAVPPRKDYFPFYPAYPNGATSETLLDRHFLFLTDFLFPSGPTAPSYFTGKSRYGLPGNVPDYGVNPASLDDKVGARRAPFERRVAMYVAKNDFINSTTYMNDEDRADAVFVWDQDDGLENGEYIAYVGTWLPGLADRVRAADETVKAAADSGVFVPDMQPQAADVPASNGADVNPLNTADGRPYDSAIRTLLAFEDKSRVEDNLPRWNPMLQMEFITERVRAQGIAQGGDGAGLLPPAAWQPAVTYTANKNGYVFYAAEEAGAWQPIVVRVTDNFLALRIRNVGKNLDVAAFSHVVLAPHKRAAGKINVNTTDLQPMVVANTPYLFSSLLGLPGMYNDFEPVAPESDIAPRNGAAASAPPVAFTGGAAVPPAPGGGLSTDNSTRATQLAGLVQAGRPVHADGRYYKSTAELVTKEGAYQFDPSDGSVFHEPANQNASLYPLSNRVDDPNENAPQPFNTNEQRFEETAARFAKMANAVTVRSDVFEILATVQAGYGLDANGDGRINYRSPDEFVTTAESKSRVVYERRSPSDTSDQSGK